MQGDELHRGWLNKPGLHEPYHYYLHGPQIMTRETLLY